jgi:hypothetical protein
MATRIRANCEDCGDVELTIGDVEVQVCTTDNSGTYRFNCPVCDSDVVKPAEPRVVDLLVASGVKLSTWDIPAEALEVKQGRPFSHDDLIDFHHRLAGDDWFAELVDGLDRNRE